MPAVAATSRVPAEQTGCGQRHIKQRAPCRGAAPGAAAWTCWPRRRRGRGGLLSSLCVGLAARARRGRARGGRRAAGGAAVGARRAGSTSSASSSSAASASMEVGVRRMAKGVGCYRPVDSLRVTRVGDAPGRRWCACAGSSRWSSRRRRALGPAASSASRTPPSPSRCSGPARNIWRRGVGRALLSTLRACCTSAAGSAGWRRRRPEGDGGARCPPRGHPRGAVAGMASGRLVIRRTAQLVSGRRLA